MYVQACPVILHHSNCIPGHTALSMKVQVFGKSFGLAAVGLTYKVDHYQIGPLFANTLGLFFQQAHISQNYMCYYGLLEWIRVNAVFCTSLVHFSKKKKRKEKMPSLPLLI